MFSNRSSSSNFHRQNKHKLRPTRPRISNGRCFNSTTDNLVMTETDKDTSSFPFFRQLGNHDKKSVLGTLNYLQTLKGHHIEPRLHDMYAYFGHSYRRC